MQEKDLEVFYRSAVDNTMQPALLAKAVGSAPRPLAVAQFIFCLPPAV